MNDDIDCYYSVTVALVTECRLQADEDIDKFLQDKHSFDDYVREVRRYRRLVDEISYTSVKVCSCIVYSTMRFG